MRLGNERNRDRGDAVGDAVDAALGGQTGAARERRGEIVGVAFEGETLVQEPLGVGLPAGHVGGSDETERDHGRARPQASLARDAVVELEAEAVGGIDPLEGLDAEVRPVRRAPVGDDHLVPEVERDRGTVEPGAEVGGGRRGADRDLHDAASAMVSGSGGTGIGGVVRRAAVSGSLRPWPVMTQTTRAPRLRPLARERGEPRRRRGLAEDALQPGEVAPGRQDLFVGQRDDRPAGARDRLLGLLPVGGLGDADRRRHREGALRRLAGEERGQSLSRLVEAEGVGAGVPATAVRESEDVGAAPELLHDLERGCFLPLEAVGVQRVDERVRAPVPELAGGGERALERALHLEQLRADRLGLGDLPAGDRARRAGG